MTKILAPLAPIGWPSAMAPPRIFTFTGFNPELSIDGDRTNGKSFVDFEEVDIGKRENFSQIIAAPDYNQLTLL